MAALWGCGCLSWEDVTPGVSQILDTAQKSHVPTLPGSVHRSTVWELGSYKSNRPLCAALNCHFLEETRALFQGFHFSGLGVTGHSFSKGQGPGCRLSELVPQRREQCQVGQRKAQLLGDNVALGQGGGHKAGYRHPGPEFQASPWPWLLHWVLLPGTTPGSGYLLLLLRLMSCLLSFSFYFFTGR